MRTVHVGQVPVVTADQMIEVDRVMMEDPGIDILQMMENAGRSLAELCIRLYAPASVMILAGTGGNGGGGMAAARHLANRGVRVQVVLAGTRERMVAAAQAQHAILLAMGVDVVDAPPETGISEVVLDALVGYSLAGAPRGRVADLIDWANALEGPVISLDVPSGFDAHTGVAREPCVNAEATLTIAALKVGLADAPQAGHVYVADISVPPRVYDAFGQATEPLFGGDWIIRVQDAGAE